LLVDGDQKTCSLHQLNVYGLPGLVLAV